MEENVKIHELDNELYSAHTNRFQRQENRNVKHKITIIFQWDGKDVMFISADDTVYGKCRTYDTEQELTKIHPNVMERIKKQMKRRKNL